MSPLLASEWRLLSRDRLVVLGALVLAVSLVYAAWSGQRYRVQWQQTAENAWQESRERLDSQIADVRAGKPVDPKVSTSAGTPRSVLLAAPAAVSPLAHFSVGQSDLYPRNTDVGLAQRVDNLFRQYQLQSPLVLASGRFDLAYVVVAILPLLAIVLCLDLIATDRTAGRLSLLTVQARRLDGVLARRLLLRGVVLVVPLSGLLLWGAASGAPWGPLLLWLALALLYAVFWLLLCAWVALRPVGPETQAAQLVGIWLLLVLALPAGINRVVETWMPPPSQQAFQVTLRQAEIDANRRAESLVQGYLGDHPELAVDGPVAYAEWMRKSHAVSRAVEQATRPVLEAHEARLAQAHRVAQWLQFLSPAAATQVALSDAAGTGPEQQAAYVAAVRGYKTRLQARLVEALYRGHRFSAEELAALPAFVPPPWTPAHGGGLLAATIGFLLALNLLLAWRVRHMTRRVSPVCA